MIAQRRKYDMTSHTWLALPRPTFLHTVGINFHFQPFGNSRSFSDEHDTISWCFNGEPGVEVTDSNEVFARLGMQPTRDT